MSKLQNESKAVAAPDISTAAEPTFEPVKLNIKSPPFQPVVALRLTCISNLNTESVKSFVTNLTPSSQITGDLPSKMC